MVSVLKIIAILISLLIIVGIPIYIFRRYRQQYHLSQGLVWGMLAFLLYTILRVFILLVFSRILPASVVRNNFVFSRPIFTALFEGLVSSLAFLVSALSIYYFQLKRMKDHEIPYLNALTFVMMSSVFLIVPLLTTARIAMVSRWGDLSSLVNANTNLENLEIMVQVIKDSSFISFLDIGLSQIFDILVYTGAFTSLYLFFVNKKSSGQVMYLFFAFAIVLSYHLLAYFSLAWFEGLDGLIVFLKGLFAILVYRLTYGNRPQEA